MFNEKLPRGSICFICHEQKMTGLTGLPSGDHLVLAPYATSAEQSLPQGGVVGNPLTRQSPKWEAGLDAKWTPNANTAIGRHAQPGRLAGRVGRGADRVQPALRPLLSRDVSATGEGPRNARLFTAGVARVKATYTFTSRASLRLIAQRVPMPSSAEVG
jgi:hypothetical protein